MTENKAHKYNTRLSSKNKKVGSSTQTNYKKMGSSTQTNYKEMDLSDSSEDDEDYETEDDEDYETEDDEDYETEDDDETEEDETDEDDYDVEDDLDGFIVKDDKKLNQRSFKHLLSELFPSNYTNENRCSSYNCSGSSSRTPDSRRSSTPKELSNFNIIFTINPSENKIDMDDMDEDEDEDAIDEDAIDEDAIDDEDDEMLIEQNVEGQDVEGQNVEEQKVEEQKIEQDISNISNASKYINELPELQKSNPIIKGVMNNLRNKERKAFKQQEQISKKKKYKNTLKFRELLQQKNAMNDLNYFQDKLTLEQQEKVLQQMEEIKALVDIEKPYRLALLESSIPPRFKACAYNKLSALKNMEPGCSEYNKVKHWVDDFMRIPFNKLNHLPVRIEDGIDKCHEFMDNAKKTLDKAVYGLNDVKLQVMQMVGQWITNPDAIGNSIAIEGPPGTGKTTLVKEGISKILNREFVFIPLGGATDSSCLEGHSYTYEGSNCGLIVKQLIQCQSMNPIIYFDELDKISDTPKGEEIVGILTHLTDTSQNSTFHDKYFAEFDFDLSRCVFFFSYNDRSKVNRILLDRMHCIMTKGYELPQKTIIAKDYLLPYIREQVRFKLEDIIIPDETIQYIVNTHTHGEDGVRNLKRCMEVIHTKLNLYRLMKPDTNLFEDDMSIKVNFPITITPKIVDKLIKKQNNDSGVWKNMYS